MAALPDFVLIDGGDQFDPNSYAPQPSSRLVWVRCATTAEMLEATDMLVRDANMAICRQRPGTSKGHCFISLEDESGIANLFVTKASFHAHKLVIIAQSVPLVEGSIQIGEGSRTPYPIPRRA